jgi:lipopolysaccharide transport system permease protein
MSTQVEVSHEPAPPPPAAEPVSPHATVIEPPGGWRLVNVRELWQFRDLLYFLVWRDVKVRYKQTVLGVAWAVLQPALMMVVFTIFFGRLAGVSSGELPYALFAYAGLLPWSFFATAVSNAGNSIVGSERLITKVYFPRLAVPLAAAGAAVVDFLFAFGLLLILMVCYQVPPGPQLLLAPVFFALILLAAVGVGTLLAALNVAYRDFRYVIPFLVQVWMFATPTVYMRPEDIGGGGLGELVLSLNPMTALVGAFRAACLGGPIDWGAVGLATLFVVAVGAAGCLFFRRVEESFADII